MTDWKEGIDLNDEKYNQLSKIKIYKVLRPTLRFCTGDEVQESMLNKYFTDFCINELIQYGYLQLIK